MTAADPITTVFTLRIRESGVYELWMEGEQVSTGSWPNGFPVTAFASPTAILLDSTAAAGAAATAIRTDATLPVFDATAPVTQAYGDTAAVGTAAKAARRDHKHGMPAAPSSNKLRYVSTDKQDLLSAASGQTATQTLTCGTYVPTDAYAVVLSVIYRRTSDTNNEALILYNFDGTTAFVVYTSGVAARGGSGGGIAILGGANNRQFKWSSTDAGSDNQVYISVVGYWTAN